MATSYWDLVIPALAMVANMAGQICSYRLATGSGGLFKSQVVGTLLGALVLALLSVKGSEVCHSGDVVTANVLLYATFCYVYFHWNNMGETARRIRMLRELESAPEGLTFEEMVARYSAREILERRLKRLTEGGQISETEGRLVMTSRTILLSARLVGLAKWIVFGARNRLNNHDHITL